MFALTITEFWMESLYGNPVLDWQINIQQPKKEKTQSQAEHADSNQVMRQSKCATVLVADDNDTVREFAKIVLSSEGHELIFAKDGLEAVASFQSNFNRIDLVILDMCMPGKSGLEVLQEIRKEYPDKKVMICTGYAMDQQLQECIKIGVQGVLQKPYRPSELLQMVKKILV